jgi:hypothetical protein
MVNEPAHSDTKGLIEARELLESKLSEMDAWSFTPSQADEPILTEAKQEAAHTAYALRLVLAELDRLALSSRPTEPDEGMEAASQSSQPTEEDVERLRKATDMLIQLCEHANRGAWENGVTDPTGSIDEGNVLAGDIISEARAALAVLPAAPQSRWRAVSEAPRDGTWVQLYSAKWPISCYPLVGWSDGPGEEWQFPAHPQWSAEMPWPTHWMPLSEPPK